MIFFEPIWVVLRDHLLVDFVELIEQLRHLALLRLGHLVPICGVFLDVFEDSLKDVVVLAQKEHV